MKLSRDAEGLRGVSDSGYLSDWVRSVRGEFLPWPDWKWYCPTSGDNTLSDPDTSDRPMLENADISKTESPPILSPIVTDTTLQPILSVPTPAFRTARPLTETIQIYKRLQLH